MRRLERLEDSHNPVLERMHIIYAQDTADFEAQQADLIAAGIARTSDTFVDWNHGLPADEYRSLEGFPEVDRRRQPDGH
jgi:hypothetical protein